MRNILSIAVVIALLAFPLAVNAGVASSSHDLVTNAPALGTGGLTDVNVCTSCHLPHNAVGGDKLWAQTIGGAGGIGGLCQSCHDGSIAAEQLTTGSLPFSGLAVHANTQDMTTCSGSASSCHDVHEQNGAVGTGKFLTTAAASDGTCDDCHDGTFPGASLNDNFTLAAGNHVQNANVGCGDCHVINVVHATPTVAAATQTGGIEASPGSYLLPVDNNEANNWGGVCVACHETQVAPYTTTISDAGYPDGTFANVSPATLLGRHVTSGSGPNHTETLSGCNTCHYVHGNTTSNAMFQKDDNTLSVYCGSCHAGGTAPDYGANSHPTAVVPTFTLPAAFPAANAIDDAGYGSTNDYGATDAFIVCETCHSVHRDGIAGTQFLRADNTNDAVCSACHTAN